MDNLPLTWEYRLETTANTECGETRHLVIIKVGDRKTSQLKRGPWDIS